MVFSAQRWVPFYFHNKFDDGAYYVAGATGSGSSSKHAMPLQFIATKVAHRSDFTTPTQPWLTRVKLVHAASLPAPVKALDVYIHGRREAGNIQFMQTADAGGFFEVTASRAADISVHQSGKDTPIVRSNLELLANHMYIIMLMGSHIEPGYNTSLKLISHVLCGTVAHDTSSDDSRQMQTVPAELTQVIDELNTTNLAQLHTIKRLEAALQDAQQKLELVSSCSSDWESSTSQRSGSQWNRISATPAASILEWFMPMRLTAFGWSALLAVLYGLFLIASTFQSKMSSRARQDSLQPQNSVQTPAVRDKADIKGCTDDVHGTASPEGSTCSDTANRFLPSTRVDQHRVEQHGDGEHSMSEAISARESTAKVGKDSGKKMQHKKACGGGPSTWGVGGVPLLAKKKQTDHHSHLRTQ